MFKHMRHLLLIIVFGTALLCSSADSQKKSPVDLNGKWTVDSGEEVQILQSGQSLRATFTEGAECPYGGSRDHFLDGQLQANSLQGSLIACTRVEKLVTDCRLDPSYALKFVGAVSADGQVIKLTGKLDYVNYDTGQGGKWVNCQVRPAAGSDKTVTLTRPCSPEKLCAAVDAALAYINGVLDNFNQSSFNAEQFTATMGQQLDFLQSEVSSCKYPTGLVIDARKSLERGALDLMLVNIQEDLKRLRVQFLQGGGPCSSSSESGGKSQSGNPSGGKDSGSGSDPSEVSKSDKSKCAESETTKTAQDVAALTSLIDSIQADIDRLSKALKVTQRARGARALQDEIERLSREKDFWRQVRLAECVPRGLADLIKTFLAAKTSGKDTVAPLGELCAKAADWVSRQNPVLQQLFSVDDCLVLGKP